MFRVICLLVLASSAARAEPVDEQFGNGVLGVKWGERLQDVQARYPHGYTWETVRASGNFYAHEMRIDANLFGIETQDLLVHLYFNENERLHVAHLFYRHGRKDDVLYGVGEVLGHDYSSSKAKNETVFSWKSERKLRVSLSIGDAKPYTWAVLSINATNLVRP